MQPFEEKDKACQATSAGLVVLVLHLLCLTSLNNSKNVDFGMLHKGGLIGGV